MNDFFWLGRSRAKAGNKESLIRLVLYLQLVFRGEKLQCGGLVPLYEGLERGGSSVKEGFEQPAVVPSGL